MYSRFLCLHLVLNAFTASVVYAQLPGNVIQLQGPASPLVGNASHANIQQQLPKSVANEQTSRPGVISTSRSFPNIQMNLLACSADEAARQAKAFRSRSICESACPAHVWLPHYQAMFPGGHKVLLDIGCNKGFSSAELFDVFAPELGINKRSLMKAYTPPGQKPDRSKCGACLSDCLEVRQTPITAHSYKRVDVHCLEPSDQHMRDLLAVRQKLFGESQPPLPPHMTVGASTAMWHLHNVAVSNTTGIMSFTSNCNNTLCHLQFGGETSTYKVQVVTVDSFLASIGSPMHINFMKIDTEGFDMNVLQGAQQALMDKVIHMLLFEYHNIQHWAHTNLSDVVSWLYSLGYVCYYEARQHIYKISGTCWHADYEMHRWSNVVCGVAGGRIELLLDAFSYLRFMRTVQATAGLPLTFQT